MTAPEPAGPQANYDGPELRSGTPEYQAGYEEYRAWAGQAGPENEPVPYALTGQAEATLDATGNAQPEPEMVPDPDPEVAAGRAGLTPRCSPRTGSRNPSQNRRLSPDVEPQ